MGQWLQRIILHDTTLREGDQSPDLVMNANVKVEVGSLLLELGVDEVEAGFPTANPDDSKVIRALADLYDGGRLVGFGRALDVDVNAVADAGASKINMFVPSSNLQIRHLMRGRSVYEVSSRLVDAIEYARELGLNVEVSLSDSTRAEEGNLRELIVSAVDAGAERIILADTVGAATPRLIRSIVRQARGLGVEHIGVHLHNDLGLALGNALAAIEAGADEVQVTVGGVGERVGNTALEELALLQVVEGSFETGLQLERVGPTVMEVLGKLRYTPCPNKPVIGRNAFSHTTDLHIRVVLEEPQAFEPVDPGIIGLDRKILLSHLLGRKSLEALLRMLNLPVDDEVVEKLLSLIKDAASSSGRPLSLDVLPNLYREVRGR